MPAPEASSLGWGFALLHTVFLFLYFLVITMGLLFLTWWARAVNRNKPSSPKHVLQVSCLWEENGNWARGAEICHQVTFGRWVGSGEMSGAQTARIRWYHQMPPCQAAQSLPCSTTHEGISYLLHLSAHLTFSLCALTSLLQHAVHLTSHSTKCESLW